MDINSDSFIINITKGDSFLWQYVPHGVAETFTVSAPVFNVDNEILEPVFSKVEKLFEAPRVLANGVLEYVCRAEYARTGSISLDICFHISPGNPVVRFCYTLRSQKSHMLTKPNDRDSIEYLGIVGKRDGIYKEISFSEFSEMTHTFNLSERIIEQKQFENGSKLSSPMLIWHFNGVSSLIAYEHGAESPDCFLSYLLTQDKDITLLAEKGNYYHNQQFGGDQVYTTVWFQCASMSGGEDELAAVYRDFQLRFASPHLESRKPYIFYNTWAAQERCKFWQGGKYLDNIKLDRMLDEIDTAHEMGIDVFVIDTGWYEKTGDWLVNTRRFPDNMKQIKEKLDAYSMKLGLWYGPTSAAITSEVYRQNPDAAIWDSPYEVWETEASYAMCLVSDYWEVFADKLIEAYHTLGVTYFKWDAISQYACSSPLHHHGNASNTEQERSECYAFQIGLYMSKVVDKLCEACPDAIVDFDITEGKRYVGLGFLSSGKYFLINNGPYYQNYDIPYDAETTYSNIFAYPGPARTWICRSPLAYDKWIPSVLFLTHYLPDDPESSQIINIASLILGQNGIWGDLLKVSPEGKRLFATILGLYKTIRDDITESTLIPYGQIGGSPEIYEKISTKSHKGAVVAFSNSNGIYEYISTNITVTTYWTTEGTAVRFDNAGRAIITLTFTKPGAQIILFGCCVKNPEDDWASVE